MIEPIHFLNQNWLWPVALAAAVLWALFIWKEYERSVSGRFWLKTLISFLGISALAMIALKPAVFRKKALQTFALLTPHYFQTDLDSLREKNPGLQTIHYFPGKDLEAKIPDADSAFILGEGLKPFDQWQLKGKTGVYLGGKAPEGIINLHYKKENRVGDSLKIKGVFTKARKGHRLVLKMSGGKVVDSLMFQKSNRQTFELGGNLKVAGDFLYVLEEKDTLGAVLSSDEFRVRVFAKPQLKVLILNSAPSFETKYLKDFLVKSGQQVLARTQVTRGKFSCEYLNMQRRSFNPFSREDLDYFDLVILDASTVKTLFKGNSNALKTAIIEDGLGVFVQADSDFFRNPPPLLSLRFRRDGKASATLPGFPERDLEKFPYSIPQDFGTEHFFCENKNRTSAYQRMGLGRMGTSTLENTYRLVLEGHKEKYARLWTKITEVLAKKENPKAMWEVSQFPIYVNEPLHFKLRTTIKDPEVKTGSESTIPLKQDPDLAYVWTGVTYPAKMGWNELSIVQDMLSDHRFYVQETTQFRALSARNTMRSNRNFFSEREKNRRVTRKPEPLDPIWFFLIFVGCMGYLWMEPKVFSTLEKGT